MEHNDHDLPKESGFEALRNADPAQHIDEPDLVAIRHKVQTDTTSTQSDHSNVRTLQLNRLPKWSYAAIAATVALGLGTGAGYSLAAKGNHSAEVTSANNSLTTPTNCPPGNLNCGTGPDFLTSASATTARSASSFSKSLSGDVMYGGYGQVWFTPSSALADDSGQAPGYIFSTEGIDPVEAFNNVARALGIQNVKTTKRSGVIELKGNNSDPQVFMNTSDLSWWFNNPAMSPWSCAEKTDAANPSIQDVSRPEPSPSCLAFDKPALSDSEAKAEAKSVFESIGLDVSNVSWDVYSGADYFGNVDDKAIPFVHVNATMLVDGSKTNLTWSIDLAPDKAVVSASGFLSKPVKTANYDTVGAKTAALRSHDLRWASSFGPQQVDSGVIEPSITARLDIGQNTPKTPNQDADGRPLLNLSLDKVQITSAEKGLIGLYLNETYVMLPAYKLCGAQQCWLQVSIADKYLNDQYLNSN